MECRLVVARGEGEKVLNEYRVSLWSDGNKFHLSVLFELYDLNHCITGPVALFQAKLTLWRPLGPLLRVDLCCSHIAGLQRGYMQAEASLAGLPSALSVVPTPVGLAPSPRKISRGQLGGDTKKVLLSLLQRDICSLFYINLFDGSHWCDPLYHKDSLFQAG